MSSIAWRLVGSAIATISEVPARETGMTLCFSQTSLADQLQDVGVDLVLVEVDRRDAVLLRQELRDLAVGDEAELLQRRSRGSGRTVAARPARAGVAGG